MNIIIKSTVIRSSYQRVHNNNNRYNIIQYYIFTQIHRIIEYIYSIYIFLTSVYICDLCNLKPANYQDLSLKILADYYPMIPRFIDNSVYYLISPIYK